MYPTVISLIRSSQEATDAGWPHPVVKIRAGDADLIACRNGLIADFLESDCTDLLMVDADISWGPTAFTRIVAHGQDFVCGVYRMRKDEEFYPICWAEKKEMWIDPETGYPLVNVDRCPVGFARLTRSCVEKMVDSLGDDFYVDAYPIDGEEGNHNPRKIPWLFDFVRVRFPGQQANIRFEEGFGLCRRWQHIGGTVWIDPAINLGHTGLKTFDGNIGDMMAAEVLQNRQFAA
jgi:hypothetical protein